MKRIILLILFVLAVDMGAQYICAATASTKGEIAHPVYKHTYTNE